MKKPLTLLERISAALGSDTLHVQQVVDALLSGSKSRGALEIDVRHELSRHSGGKRLALFLRVAHGWYRNRTAGDPRKDPAVPRMASGRLTQIVYDAIGVSTVDANEAVRRVKSYGGVPSVRCDRTHIGAVLYGNCRRGLLCFERVSFGHYRAIPGRRPRVDPSGRSCAAKGLP
jgi:hypothetical protein